MSLFTTGIVEKPKWFRIKPIKNGWGKRPPYVIGFDSEAYNGAPFLMQFSLPGEDVSETRLVWTTPKTVLEDFLEFLDPIAHEWSRSHRIVVVGWNLRYEYTQLFRNIAPEAWEQSHFQLHQHDIGECEGDPRDDWSTMIDAMNDKRYTFKLSFNGQADRGGKRRDRYPVTVIDGMAYFSTSLDKAAGIVGVQGKDDFPEELKGKISPRKALHNQAFLDYSKRDAWITRKVGETIIGYHQQYDVPLTLSAPMYASHVFRRKFLTAEIPLCDEPLENAGLQSYHGGKNGLYIPRPMHFDDAYDYDINAAYTSAMSALPDPTTAIWDEVARYEPGTHSLWYIVGDTHSCDYRAFQEASGRWYTWREDGTLGFWITGYELDTALRHGELSQIYECTGYVMRGEPATGPLKAYCDEMSYLKKHGATLEIRTMAKLCLNSLYGKLIQKVPNTYDSVFPMFDVVEKEDGTYYVSDPNMVEGGYKAGGLYHPALASLITGYVRAKVHDLEHKYQSLMTSTDGFLSLVPPDPTDIGDHVGGLKVKRGKLSIWRERLYLFETGEHDEKCQHDKDICSGDVFALHGFRGKKTDLRMVPLEPGKYGYRGRQMVGLRESRRRWDGNLYDPGTFAELPYELDLTVVGSRSPVRGVNEQVKIA